MNRDKNKIIQGDCLEVLKTLPSESINCVVTSPPYWALRSYLPDEVKLKDDLPEEKKKEIEKELTLLGIKNIIR
jgi:DNA modification methylase